MLAGRRVAVTGAYGFIGQHLLRALDAAGAAPVALVHRDDEATDVPGERRVVDLREPDAVVDAMIGSDLVVHLAARSGGIQFQHDGHRRVLEENTTITRNVLDAAVTVGVDRMFLASSGVVYSHRAVGILAEGSPVVSPADEPVTGYAWSKLTDEVFARWVSEGGVLDVVAGRFTNVYGPGGSFDPERSTVVHALIKKAVDNAPEGKLRVWGDGSPVRSFIYVEDAVRAVVAVLTRGEAGAVYNITATEPVSIAEVAHEIRALVSPDLGVVFEPERPQGPPERVLDGSRLNATGFATQVPFREGLRRTVAAYEASVPGP